MFERFTERARQVVVLAQDEARLLKHNYIGTEHLLLGVLREEEGIGAQVLESFGLTVEEAQAQVVRIIGRGEHSESGQIPFTPRAVRALELASEEGRRLAHPWIGTEHLLLGLAAVEDGVAARIMLDFGADPATIHADVLARLAGEAPAGRGPVALTSPPFSHEFLEDLERVVRGSDRRRRLQQKARHVQRLWESRHH